MSGRPPLDPTLPLPAAPREALALVTPDGREHADAALRAAIGRALAGLRQQRLVPGARLVLALPRSLEFVAVHLAALRSGAVSVPVSPAATASEVSRLAEASRAQLVVDEALARRWLAARDAPCDPSDLPRPAGRDPALLLMTSGTTGAPKGVLHTHAALRRQVEDLAACWDVTPADVLIHALPLYHVHGLVVALHVALASGARVVLLERFEPEAVVRAVATRGGTLFMGVPTMYHRLLQLPEAGTRPLASLRLATCGSAPLRAETAAAFLRRTGRRLLVRYGLTEALIVTSQRLDEERDPHGVGRPLPGVGLRIVDPESQREVPAGAVGSVRVRGPTVFAGYEGGGGGPDAAGEFDTGDLGFVDATGELQLVGRRRELIITGGHNVHPREVETVLEREDSVAECAVTGLPDEDLGELVAAAVVGAPGRPPDLPALRARCSSELPRFKQPRAWLVLEALPRTPLGKLRRDALSALPGWTRTR